MATKSKIKKVINPYSVTLKIMGNTFTARGKTALDAIDKLDIGNSKGRGIITMTHGKNSKERVLLPNIVARLFTSRGLAREVGMKQASILFDKL